MKDANKVTKEGAMKIVLAGVGAIALLAGALVVLFFGGILGNRVQANYNARVVTSKVQQNVRTAAFAQEVYEQFYDDCNAVVADNQKIAIARERVAATNAASDDTFGTKAAKVADAQADLAGVQQAQADTAASYNAAAAEYTRGQFLSQNLPPRLDPPYDVACP